MTRTIRRTARTFHRAPVVRSAPTLADLRRLVADATASIAQLPGDSTEARRRADLVVDALLPVVRLPVSGRARVEDRQAVTLRELAVLQRWLGRASDVPQHQVVRAVARIEQGLAQG